MNRRKKGRKPAQPNMHCPHCGVALNDTNSVTVTMREGPVRVHHYFDCNPQRDKWLGEQKAADRAPVRPPAAVCQVCGHDSHQHERQVGANGGWGKCRVDGCECNQGVMAGGRS